MTLRKMNSQEQFWQGSFGNEYISRNTEELLYANKLAFFASALRRMSTIDSAIEFGCNIGLNLQAIQQLLPKTELHGIEINAQAIESISARLPTVNVHKGSFLDLEIDRQFDLVFTFAVLIHVSPEDLNLVFDRIQDLTRRYVLMVEYYNSEPVSVSYRNHEGQMFKRDFAGQFLDRFQNFKLVDYGFVWHRDPAFPLGDNTWFLMERR